MIVEKLASAGTKVIMLDYIGIFKELNERKIRYIVVGGVAVNLHGIPRMTYDIDLMLDLRDKNPEKFVSLMREWGFKPKIPVPISDLARKEKREEWGKHRNMAAFSLVNPEWAMSEIDVIIGGPIDYQKASGKIKRIRVQNTTIPLLSVDDLILMRNGERAGNRTRPTSVTSRNWVMKRADDYGFDYYLDAERIRDYQAKPYALRLQWLYQGNLFRKAYPKRIVRRQDTFRRV